LNNKNVLDWKFMKNDLQTSVSEKISRSLLDGALPVMAVASATRAVDGKSTMRVSSLESMVASNASTDAKGLKLHDKATQPGKKSPATDDNGGAKVLSIKPGAV